MTIKKTTGSTVTAIIDYDIDLLLPGGKAFSC